MVNDLNVNSTDCQCTYFFSNFINNKDKIGIVKRKLISEYTEWLLSIEKIFYSSDATYIWLNSHNNYLKLAYFNILLPGPKWINKCLVNAKNIRHTVKEFKGYKIDTPPNKYNYKFSLVDRTDIAHNNNFFSLPVFNLFKNKVNSKIIKLIRYIEKINHKHDGRYFSGFKQINSDFFYLQYGSCVSAWLTGVHILRNSLDIAFHDDELWSNKKYQNRTSMTINYMWNEWVNGGPGMFLWSHYENYIKLHNTDFVDIYTNFWIKNYLLDLYFMYVGMACLKIIDCEKISILHIERYLNDIGEVPICFVETKDNKIVVHYMSMNSSKQEFLSLKQSGFVGADKNFMTKRNCCDKLFNLLHIHPYKLEKWYTKWDELYSRDYENNSIKRQN